MGIRCSQFYTSKYLVIEYARMDEIISKIANIIPISRVNKIDTLSYFTLKKVSPGELVHIIVGKSTLYGIILNVSFLNPNKRTDLKKVRFELRKISATTGRKLVSEKMLEALWLVSEYFALHLCTILDVVTSTSVIKSNLSLDTMQTKKTASKKAVVKYIQGNYDSRISQYTKLIIGRKKTFLLCRNDFAIEEIAARLSHHQPMIIKTKGSIKMLDVNRKLIISTISNLSLIDESFDQIIIDEERSLRKGLPTREIDLVTLVTIVAKHLNITLVIGDELLSLESHNNHTPPSQTYPKLEIKFTDDIKVRPDLKDAKNIFIYVPRRGYSPVTYCSDCGNILSCDICKYPLNLMSNRDRIYKCLRCNRDYKSDISCKTCGSWNLKPFGLGIEKARETAQIIAGPLGHITCDTKIPAVEHFDRVVALSMDTLLGIPSFDINLEILGKLLDLSKLTKSPIIIETKSASGIFERIKMGSTVEELVAHEFEIRRKLLYPPFSLIIKIESRASEKLIHSTINELEKNLVDYDYISYPAFVPIINKQHHYNTVIKVTQEEWPNKRLVAILKTLGHQYRIVVGSRDLL